MRKLSMSELERMTPAAFKHADKVPIVLVLDNIRSALNVGSAFRTADAFALEKIYLCGITAVPPHREILKTALGSTDTVAWEYFESSSELALALNRQGYRIVAVEQTKGSIGLESFDMMGNEKLALVFGNEVDGVGEAFLQASHASIEIPQFGTKHSLNVAVCVGIVTWELVRKIKFGH